MKNSNNLSDAIARVNNAQKIKKQYVIVKYSQLIITIFRLLLKLGYIEKVQKIIYKKNISLLKIYLKYESKIYNSVIKEFKIISKPGRRIFMKYNKIKRFYNGLGTIIISSSKGVITDYYAIENKVGGELLCKII